MPSGTPAVCCHALTAAQKHAGRTIPHREHHVVRIQTQQFLWAVTLHPELTSAQGHRVSPGRVKVLVCPATWHVVLPAQKWTG